jgi:hypothetical protein
VLTERLFRPAGMSTARLLTDRAVIPWRARGRFPEHDTSIIILANRDGFPVYRLARRITDEILGLPGPAGPAPAPGPIPAALAGTYRDTLASAQVSAAGDRLRIEHAGVTRTMVPAGPASFTDQEDPEIRLRVHATDGRPDAVTLDFPFTWFTGYRHAEGDPAA